MIRLALLDDHPAVLAGLRRLVEPEPDLVVVGAAPSAAELGPQRADVVVLDHDLAHSDGLSLCRRIKDRPDAPAVVIYSAFPSSALALAARVAHADAVVNKTEPVASLLAAIRAVAAGNTVLPEIPREAYGPAVGRLPGEDLPVLAMLLDGESPPAIAEALRTEPAEIEWRAQRIIARVRPGARQRADEEVLDGPSAMMSARG